MIQFNRVKTLKIFVLVAVLAILAACSKNDPNIDTAAPVIDMNSVSAFPKPCGVLIKGDTAWIQAIIRDEGGLGSFSMDIHHNFDQHAHGTEVESCVMGPIKAAVRPFTFVKTYPITGAPKIYTLRVPVFIPSDVDAGDYHFMIRATDAQGWQSMRGISIKIID
jgi:hypothetical protein